MRPGRNIFAVLVILAAASLFLAACRPKDQVAAEEAEANEALQQEAAAQAADSQVIAQPVPIEEASAPVNEVLTAELTVVEGSVALLRDGEEEFNAVSNTAQIGVGDIVRTQADGVAIIKFVENTEAILFPNSQLQVKTLQELESGALRIVLQQFVGRAFHRANFTLAGSTYDVETTNAVAAVQGTAFYADVIYQALADQTPEDIEAFINSIDFFQTAFGSDPKLLNDLDAIDADFDIAGGVVTFSYLVNGELESVTLGSGKTITITRFGDERNWMAIDEDTSLLNTALAGYQPGYDGDRVVQGDTTRYCGDSICDPYLGENVNTCSLDCSE